MYNKDNMLVWTNVCLLCRYAFYSVPQTLRLGNCLLMNSSSDVYLCRCSTRLSMPSLDSDSFIKINCDW